MKGFELDKDWIEKAAKSVISKFWDIENYKIVDSENVSAIFLAWAPGAWKTEFLETIFDDLKKKFIVIDIDSYRWLFKWYDWANSSDYQRASVRVADKILSYCFKNNLNFIFDGTFRNYNKVKQNFWQCEKYKRNSLVTLVFQDPRISFYYTFLRKMNKKRNVPIDVFIDWFYGSIENTFQAKNDFKKLDIMIAYKKYSLHNKNRFIYDINYNIQNIHDFCKEYKIWYHKGIFKNRHLVKLDILAFNNTLTAHFSSKTWLLKRIWCRMKIEVVERLFKI